MNILAVDVKPGMHVIFPVNGKNRIGTVSMVHPTKNSSAYIDIYLSPQGNTIRRLRAHKTQEVEIYD